MGSYKIEVIDLFVFVKYLGQPKILSVEGHQWHVILLEVCQWHGNDEDGESSSSVTLFTLAQTPSAQVPWSKMGKLFPSPFVHKYMVQDCKYKWGSLGRNEQEMPTFIDTSKAQITKIGLGSDGSVKQKWGPIKFVKECNLTELFDDIYEDLWIDDTLQFEFDCFTIDDDILEYLGEHLEFPKSNEKQNASYVINEYAYFCQEIKFNKVFQVQPMDGDDTNI